MFWMPLIGAKERSIGGVERLHDTIVRNRHHNQPFPKRFYRLMVIAIVLTCAKGVSSRA